MRLALLVSGASGMRLPQEALRRMADSDSIERIHLVVSKGAEAVLRHEIGSTSGEGGSASGEASSAGLLRSAGLGPEAIAKVTVHADDELDAEIASGSHRLDGTAVVPCSGATLADLATGRSSTLILRACTVALKERWPLVLGFRETPLNLVHIENMRHLAYRGATLLPPMPAFYVGGNDLDRFVDAWVLRLFDCLGVPSGGAGLRWRGDVQSEGGDSA